jgi:hypothetical protein
VSYAGFSRQSEIQVNNEPELTMSPLCQPLTVEGQSLQVVIFRGDTNDWILEVVDSRGTSIVWDDLFETDLLAFEELLRAIREEGIHAILETPQDGLR